MSDATPPKWTTLSRETLVTGPHYAFCHDRYQLPRGRIGDYYYVDVRGSTMVVPEMADGRLVLTRQHRYLLQRPSLEFPAGGLAKGLAPLANARRELREETGYEAESWSKIGEFAPHNGASNEICHLFVARGLTLVGAQPEPTEELEVLYLTLEELGDRIALGEVWDGQTIAAFALYERWRRR